MDKINLNIRFEQVEDFVHPEFTKVKVWVATYGENANGSNITKEAFEKALSSLKNVPILGEWSESIEDFKGHGGKLEISDDGIKFIETTKAYGVIPESCNPIWELDEEGIEYLVCDGILWTGRYPEAEKVMENTNNQSMEISVLNYENQDGIMVINEFDFTGICILGQDTQPCFPSAKVVYSLNKDEYKKEFSIMLNEIKNINFSKGGRQVDERKELIEKYSYLKSEKFEEIINNENLTIEELKNELFALSVNDLELKIREKLKENTEVHTDWWGDTYECQKYYLQDLLVSENIAICEDANYWYKYYGIPFAINGDSVTLDFEGIKRYVRGDWREYVEGEKEVVSNIFEVEIKHNQEKLNDFKESFNSKEEELENVKNDYSTIAEENRSLKEFKLNIEKQEKDDSLNEIFEKYSLLKECDGYEELFNNRYELDEKELVKSLKVLAYDNGITIKTDKQNFSIKTTRVPVMSPIPEGSSDSSWSILDKHIKSN